MKHGWGACKNFLVGLWIGMGMEFGAFFKFAPTQHNKNDRLEKNHTMEQQQNIPTFKMILVGDGAVGKTTFVKRHITGEFEKKYIATIGVEVHPLKFHTNRGVICFNVWDTAGLQIVSEFLNLFFFIHRFCTGQEKYGGLRDGY